MHKIETDKLNIKDDNHNRKQIMKEMKKINNNHDELRNQQTSLESYIEKYMPLKFQHQFSETIIDCLDKKARVRFAEINNVMSDALRQDIMNDTGNTKFKTKCLDLITKLRLEVNVLNSAKTQKAGPKDGGVNPQLRDVGAYDANFKEPLGLDENGQIKVSHDVDDIKKMVELGMIKTGQNRMPTKKISTLKAENGDQVSGQLDSHSSVKLAQDSRVDANITGTPGTEKTPQNELAGKIAAQGNSTPGLPGKQSDRTSTIIEDDLDTARSKISAPPVAARSGNNE